MPQPYVGEIKMFAGNFAPEGWAFCDGQLMAIADNDPLFNLIGTTYGGDGQATFALPDLRGRLPLHQTSGFALGQTGGVESVTLGVNQIPQHTHALLPGTDIGTNSVPTNNRLAQSDTLKMYSTVAPSSALGPESIGQTGGGQPHTNFQRYLCVNFIISLFGLYPTQN